MRTSTSRAAIAANRLNSAEKNFTISVYAAGKLSRNLPKYICGIAGKASGMTLHHEYSNVMDTNARIVGVQIISRLTILSPFLPAVLTTTAIYRHSADHAIAEKVRDERLPHRRKSSSDGLVEFSF
jgi:hypothetical protein